MPIYIGDYLADTAHLDTVEHGAYLLLIFHYWRKGPLANDEAQLSSIARLRGSVHWPSIWDAMQEFFQLGEDGLFHHKRIDAELELAQTRRRKGSAGAAGKWGEATPEEANRATRSQRISEARKKGTHTTEEWKRLLDVCQNACLRCGEMGAELVKDHIIPIYQGGSDGLENIQPLCRKCNAAKGPETKDYRPLNWQNACKMPAKCLPESVLDAWTSPSPSPSPKQKQVSEANASSPRTESGDLAFEAEEPVDDEREARMPAGKMRPEEAIYAAYPRKVGKKAAIKAILRALQHVRARGMPQREAEVWLYRRVHAYARSPAGNDGEFTPHPATWFNQGRYDDDPQEWLLRAHEAREHGRQSGRAGLTAGDVAATHALLGYGAQGEPAGRGD